MRIILGGINGQYLRSITDNAASKTERVDAAVAYATDSSLLFDWCLEHGIPLKFFGRLDDNVAVSTPILERFLNKKSPSFSCQLVQHHHAKVIWWHGVGIYIGSANLTSSAWYTNVEAGCFFPDEEITDEIASDIRRLFVVLEKNSTPLTSELLAEMKSRAAIVASARPTSKEFWSSSSFTKWAGLSTISSRSAEENHRAAFLKEWYSTLQQLRDIGEKVSLPENRPSWVSPDAPIGTQADQFLHAHYYQRTFSGNRAQYAELFEANKSAPEKALSDAITWWRNLEHPPGGEARMLNETAPFLRKILSTEEINSLDYEKFYQVCCGVHAIRDYSRRVRNKAVGLPDGQAYEIPQKIKALSTRIWNDRSVGGRSVGELMSYILYGGSLELVPERLWEGIANKNWKIDGLGISALGELVGWAMPNVFPPRNGRTSKALKSLGYDVAIHVE